MKGTETLTLKISTPLVMETRMLYPPTWMNKPSQVKCVTKLLIYLRRKSVALSCLTLGCCSAHGSHLTCHGFWRLEMASYGHMDVTVHCCSSFVGEAQPLLDTSYSCQMGPFDPLFVLHKTRANTSSQKVSDNECVNSMLSCCILQHVAKSSLLTQTKESISAFHLVVRLSSNQYLQDTIQL